MYITKKKPLLQMAARNYKLHDVLLFGTGIQGYFMYLSTDKWIANRKRHSRCLLSYHPQYAELFRRNINVYNLHLISCVCIHYDDVIMSVMSQSHHQHHDCSLNRLFRRRSKKTSKLRVIGLRGIHRSPVNFPHKWPVTLKMFPFDDVIMCIEMTRV